MGNNFSADGQPIQAGLLHESVVLTNNSPSYSMFGLHEAVVVSRRYVKEPNNPSKVQVVYECRDLETGDVLPGCRQLSAMSGKTNGDDNVLHPSTQPMPGVRVSKTGINQTPAKSTDGDRVLLGFLGGSRTRPIIIGVFRHSSAEYGATVDDGERRLTIHQGTSIQIKSDGEYVVTHKTGSVVTLLDSGDVQVRPAAGKDVFIGDQDATENLVLGQKFKQFASDLIDALLTAKYPTGTGPSGPMLSPEAATLSSLKASLNTLLSDMAFTQKEQA